MGKNALLLSYHSLLLYVLFVKGNTNDIGYFWQLSDVHLNLDYSNHSCADTFGDPNHDSPMELLQFAMSAMHNYSLSSRPDFVIWSGDNGPHVNNISVTRLENHIQAVSKALRTVFSADQVYILPTVGNHDVTPGNQMSPIPHEAKRLSWCNKLATKSELWAPWIGQLDPMNNSTKNISLSTTPPWANFSVGCFHSHLLPERRLLLVALNALIWYTGNSLAGNAGPDPLDQLSWLTETFLWARKTQHKVLLVSHFPPGASENSPQKFQFLRTEINDQFVHLLQKYSDVLMAGLFGHEHVDSFRVLYDEKKQPVASLLLAPSICPLRLHGLGSFNPRIRLYRYERLTRSLIGYKQYVLNLDLGCKSQWELEYDTQSDYALSDLSPNSLAQFLNQLACDEAPDGLWSQYWKHELGGRPHEFRPGILTPDGLCPRAASMCRCEHLCAMRHLLTSSLRQCLQNCSHVNGFLAHCRADYVTPISVVRTNPGKSPVISGTSESSGTDKGSSLPIIVGVIIAFLAILVGVVLLVNREICQKRGRYGNRFGTGGNSIGGVIFSSLGNSIGVNGLTSPHAVCGDSIAGSCTELRVGFQPHYAMEDELSVATQGTLDQYDNSPYPPRVPRTSQDSASHKKHLIQLPAGRSANSQRRVNGHLGLGRSSSKNVPKDNRHSLSDFGRDKSRSGFHMTCDTEAMVHELSPGNAVHLGEHGSVHTAGSSMVGLPSAAVSNLNYPPEDYYADDEQAFGDDELEEEDDDEQSEMLHNATDSKVGPNDEPTSSTDSGPFDDGGKPLNSTSNKLTKTRSIKDWNLIGKRNSKRGGHRRLSVEDPLSCNLAGRLGRSADSSTVGEHAMAHSQSVTMGLSAQSISTNPDPTLNISPANITGVIHPSCRIDAAEHDQSLVNSVLSEPATRPNGRGRELTSTGVVLQPVGYDYVRM